MSDVVHFLASLLPVCPFFTVTGIPCPGCGSTRAVIALAEGRIGDAIAYNPLLVIGGGAFLIYLAVGLAMYCRTGRFPDIAMTPGRLKFFRIFAVIGIAVNWIYLIMFLR